MHVGSWGVVDLVGGHFYGALNRCKSSSMSGFDHKTMNLMVGLEMESSDIAGSACGLANWSFGGPGRSLKIWYRVFLSFQDSEKYSKNWNHTKYCIGNI